MTQQPFIKREGSRLMEGAKPFRFGGPNIYWLGLDENVGGIDWPTPFRVIDALDTAKEMGATVVRSHTMAASQGCPKALSPKLGEYNEEAFRRVDFAIKEAGRRGLRLIIPFVCNWSYYHGGRSTFTGWRGLEDPNAFYTDEEVVRDFKAYIYTIVNRVNSYTGIAYKDDPMILAWELGNELNDAPAAWVEEICTFLKQIAPRHLTAHGKQFQLDADKIAIPSLDILDVHYYPANAEELLRDARAVQAAGKVYIAGEYGWPDCDLQAFLTAAEIEEAVSGTCFWSLFGHHDEGGYVQHYDGFAVHYPGCGINEELQQRIQQLREHAFRMSGRSLPETSLPDAPVITAAAAAVKIRGTVGAAYYTIEKSTEGEGGPWRIVYDKQPVQHAGTWIDPTRIHTKEAYYRVKAHSLSGEAGVYSSVYKSNPF
ncbi:mannan endo-1,4-beta-mannosidase [Paenibacillus endophyticus]|uniref:mannan endo-1,4-beta-mannosidase n=1 Tax=Paenibacillus endophyticus TaxID=1294268 RepID=A0A7W5CBE8_9BACL|nr:cellulase family glycosylhydrolase [Paenibacillus endophyticus]MBB3154094.1 mannan endo-1,4-beta-mannosidase [Paenibacillus endophyticus]